jgi:hypothetical protein
MVFRHEVPCLRGGVHADYYAKNGLENARNGLTIIENNLGLDSLSYLVAVIHSTQTRRLGETLAAQANQKVLTVGKIVYYPTKYPFNPENRFDAYEAAGELTRLDAFSRSDEPVFARPSDFPEELLEYARDLEASLY